MLGSIRRLIRNDDGQAIIEFVLVFPIVLLLIISIIEFSLLGTAYLNVNYAAFAAARAKMVGGDDHLAAALALTAISPKYIEGLSPADNLPQFVKDIIAKIMKLVPSVIDRAAYAYELTEVDSSTSGDTVKTTVTYYYLLKFPITNVLSQWVVENIAQQSIGPSPEDQDIYFVSSIPQDKWDKAKRWSQQTGLRFVPIVESAQLMNL